MTEHNYFCRAQKYAKQNSTQQNKYRIFNKQVTEEEYEAVRKIKCKLEFDESEDCETRYQTAQDCETRYQTAFIKMRNNLSEEGQKEYLDIPHFDRE